MSDVAAFPAGRDQEVVDLSQCKASLVAIESGIMWLYEMVAIGLDVTSLLGLAEMALYCWVCKV